MKPLSLFFSILTLTMLGQAQSSGAPDLAQLQKMSARFAPTPIRVDVSKLSAGDRNALVKLIEASRILNEVFMHQYWSGDVALHE